MKLSSLFSKFLYQHKELKLPGIGVFTLDPSIPVPEPTDKNFAELTQHIRFVQQPVAQPDDEFINFIRTETGKIKPLAESDLDLFLSDGKILLNIGKPFHIEGIGSITKTREGKYEFTPGEVVLHKSSITAQESVEEKKSHFTDDDSSQNNNRKLLVALAVVAGIALIIWLGYSLYNRNTSKTAAAHPDIVTGPPPESSATSALLDSVQNKIDSVRNALTRSNSAEAGRYKFVIERTANKARAYRRYNQIKETLTDIRLDASADSSLFKLFFILPAQPSDTARIKDSLRIWYGRKQVWIE